MLQPHPARLKLRDALFGVDFFELRQLCFTVDGVDRLLHVSQRGCGSAQRGLCDRQRNARDFNKSFLIRMFRGRHGDRIIGLRQRLGQLHGLLLRGKQTRLPLLGFGCHARGALTLERELLLGARDLRIDFVERALRRVLRVVLGEHVLTQALKLRHQRLQLGFFREQRSFGFAEHFDSGFSRFCSLVTALCEQQRLAIEFFFFELAITRCDFGLAFEAIHLRGQLGLNVVNTRKIFFGVGETTFGVFAPLFVARHASGFFEEHAQFLGLGLDDARNHALLDYRVRAWT